jgi:hypothetical protein
MGQLNRLTRGVLVASAAFMCIGTDVPATELEFGTGFVPVDQATYKSFPKVGRYRAFFGAKADLTDRFPKPWAPGAAGLLLRLGDRLRGALLPDRRRSRPARQRPR